MKKLTLILALALTCTQANDDFSQYEDRDSKKRWFFGIDGGVGLLDLAESAIIAAVNIRISGRNPVISSTSYFGRLTMGWQRYTSEKIGYRLSWGFGGFGATNFKSFSGDELLPQSVQGGLFGGSIDGLFDFVRKGDKHFGILSGVGIDGTVFSSGDAMKGMGGLSSLLAFKLGFYLQTGSEVFELAGNVPIIGFVFFHGSKAWLAPVHSTLSLGYKHLF